MLVSLALDRLFWRRKKQFLLFTKRYCYFSWSVTYLNGSFTSKYYSFNFFMLNAVFSLNKQNDKHKDYRKPAIRRTNRNTYGMLDAMV